MTTIQYDAKAIAAAVRGEFGLRTSRSSTTAVRGYRQRTSGLEVRREAGDSMFGYTDFIRIDFVGSARRQVTPEQVATFLSERGLNATAHSAWVTVDAK